MKEENDDVMTKTIEWFYNCQTSDIYAGGIVWHVGVKFRDAGLTPMFDWVITTKHLGNYRYVLFFFVKFVDVRLKQWLIDWDL